MEKIQLCSLEKCTSCQACMQSCPKHCITMKESDKGFRHPAIVKNACVECGTCVRACHQLNDSIVKHTPIKVYAAWHKDKAIHAASSSGGAFTAIAESIIAKNGVVFGASVCEDGRVRHIHVENKVDLQRLRGSKYVQSDIADSYSKVKAFLKEGCIVLFVGSPCQVSGLYAFLGKKYENLYTCDFVCHGVPSQKALEIYKRKMRTESTNSVVAFRDNRVCGYRLTLDDIPVSPINDYYMRAFNKGLMFMDACYACKYARPERVADFTIGDFWGIGAKKPLIHDTPLGISLLMINTDEAEKLFAVFKDAINYEERDLDEAVAGNHNLSKVSASSCNRDEFYRDFENLGKWALMKKYNLYPSIRDFIRPLKRMYKIYKIK